MAVETVRYRSRRKRESDRAAAKAKREKILLAVFGVVLLGVVAFQGPKMLKLMHGSSGTPAPAPAATAAGGTASTAAATAKTAADLSKLEAYPQKDPFIQQLGGGGTGSLALSTATPPHVRATHFVAKDPFVQQLTVAAPAAAASTSSVTPPPASGGQMQPATASKPSPPAPAAGNGGNYIVMLASVPLSSGHPDAAGAAAAARAKGITNVKIVDSSTYPTLNAGYYAVYSGPYATLGDVLSALQTIRGQGYPSSYTRRLAH
jgi:hypothetical protein